MEGDVPKSFFEKAMSGVTKRDAEEKTKKFFELMSSEKVFRNYRERFLEQASIKEENGQEYVDLDEKDVAVFMHYFNYMYSIFMGMIDAWQNPHGDEIN